MFMMTSQILKSVHSTRTQKSKYAGERNIVFSSDKKNYQLHIKGYFIAKDCFVAEVTFKFLSLTKTFVTVMVNSQTQFIGNEEKKTREKASRSQSFQRKSFLLMAVVSFSGRNSF